MFSRLRSQSLTRLYGLSMYWLTQIMLYGVVGFLFKLLIVFWYGLIVASFAACFSGTATILMMICGISVAVSFTMLSIAAYGTFYRGFIASAVIITVGLVNEIGGLLGAYILVFSIMLKAAQSVPDPTGSTGFCAGIAWMIESGALAVFSSSLGSKEKPVLNYLKGFMPLLYVFLALIVSSILIQLYCSHCCL